MNISKIILAVAMAAGLACTAAARTMTVTENKVNGVLTSFDLTFSAESADTTNAVWMVCGDADYGTTDLLDWPSVRFVGLVPGDVTSMANVPLPAGWDVALTHLRFFLCEEDSSGIELLDNIGASGTQYVTTTFKPDYKTAVEVDLAFTSAAGNQNIFCARGSETTVNTFTLFWLDGKHWRWDYSSYQKYSGNQTPGTTRHILRADLNGLSVDGTLDPATSPPASIFTAGGTLSIFASHKGGSDWNYYGQWKLYSFKAWANGSDAATLKLDMIPCRKNGTVCLLENVSGTFLTNRGTGTFTAGDVTASSATTPVVASDLVAPFAAATWTGNGGADTRVSTPANWGEADNTDLPDIYGGTLSVSFPAGGEALLDSAVAWRSLSFTAPAAFTFADAANALSIGAHGIRTALDAKPTVTHTFNVPLMLTAQQEWFANTNATIKVMKPMSFVNSANTLTLAGAGIYEFHATGTFSNDVISTGDGFSVTGPGRVRVYAGNGLGGPGGRFKMDLMRGALEFYGVTNSRPIETYCAGGDKDCGLWLLGSAGTTNVFDAPFYHAQQNLKLRIGRGTTFVVNKQFKTVSACYCSVSGSGSASARWIVNAPLYIGDRFNWLSGMILDLNVPTNRINGNTGNIGGLINLNVPYALAHVNGSGGATQFIAMGGTLDLHGNDNGLGVIYTPWSDRRGTITSETPATMHLVDDYQIPNYDSGQKDANGNKISVPGYTNRVAFTGCVSLSKEGKYTNRLMKVSSTYGDLTVTKGRLEMDPGATWANASNLVVKGTGLFTLEEHPASAPAFGKHVVVRIEPGLDGNGANPKARIELLNTTIQRCAEFYVDGVRQSEGLWGSAAAAAANPSLRIHTAPFFTGTGLMMVYSGVGVIINFR